MALSANADVRWIVQRLRPGAQWGWKGGSANDPAQLVWRDRVQFEPSIAELEAEWTAIEAETTSATAVKQTFRDKVDAVAGKTVAELTNQERLDMLEVLIAIVGGIDFATRTTKPAAQWSAARKLLDT